MIQNYKEDTEAIEAFLANPVDSAQLQKLKTTSNLLSTSKTDNKPKEKALVKMFQSIKDIKHRNRQILKAIKKGYSQHRIAKVLGISQPAVYGVVKRSRK